jgi:hypothetical protein
MQVNVSIRPEYLTDSLMKEISGNIKQRVEKTVRERLNPLKEQIEQVNGIVDVEVSRDPIKIEIKGADLKLHHEAGNLLRRA